MGKLDHWLGGTKLAQWVGDKARPASVGNIIADKPVLITITRQNKTTQVLSTLDPQTVRIDTLSGYGEDLSFGGNADVRTHGFVLLGYKNHPTEDDTDIQTGDTFPYESQLFSVMKVEAGMSDRVLAFVEAQE